MLGTLLADNKTYSRVAAFLRPTHFGNGLHSRTYEAIAAQIESGAVSNPITIKHFLEDDPALIEAGKPARQYLVELVAAAMDDISAEDYARIVVELYGLRTVAADDLRDRLGEEPLESGGGGRESAPENTLPVRTAGSTRSCTMGRICTRSALPVGPGGRCRSVNGAFRIGSRCAVPPGSMALQAPARAC